MGIRPREAPGEALTATVATALRQQSRQSVHPADQAALHRAAAQIAQAVEGDFLVFARHSSIAKLTDQQQLSRTVHE
jgi:hypothetical protein